MNKIIACTVVYLLLTTTRIAHSAVLSGPILNPANNHLYYLLSQDSWTNSETQAVALGGHLATINDSAEQTFVVNTFANDRNIWIGMYDPTQDASGGHAANFVWVSGSSITYTNWGSGEPNDAAGDHSLHEYWTYMWGNNADIAYYSGLRPKGTWNDGVNGGYDPNGVFSVPYGIVEVVPEPASLLLLSAASALMLRRRPARRDTFRKC